mgnify:FL=1
MGVLYAVLEALDGNELSALIGLIGGILLGLAARMGRFCTLGAIEDATYGGSQIRVRMWSIALGLSIISVHFLSNFGLINSLESLYLSTEWNPYSSVVGGLLFGYGMAICGNCGYGALARLGGGDLRSFVIVLVMGVSAYITISGPLAKTRASLFPVMPLESPTPPSLSYLGFHSLGINPVIGGSIIGVIFLIYGLYNWKNKIQFNSIFWSVIVAIAIVAGWLGTSWVASISYEPNAIQSFTFVAPVGETILYAMYGSAINIKFGIGAVLGVLIGAFIGSLIKGHFRWEACEDPRELKRQILGASIMGVGAVLSFGCSVGQGLTAFSTLSYSAPITLFCIFVGARIGLFQLIEGFQPAE